MQETREFKSNLFTNNIIASVQSDLGYVREVNEDRGLHVKLNDPDTNFRKGTLTIVADGMGGHSSGEVASELAVQLISQFYYENETDSAGIALKSSIEEANKVIYETSLSDESLYGMGTTLVALVLQNDNAFIAHVGDSRLYLMRDGNFKQITDDHSEVMELVKKGIISREQARTHEDKNVILRAVGTQPKVEAELSKPLKTELNDTFLLCSDGLSDLVENWEIGQILLMENNVHAACDMLIEKAKTRGAHDNITVGIVRLTAQELDKKPNLRVTRELEVMK